MDVRLVKYFNKMAEIIEIIVSNVKSNIDYRTLKDVLADSTCEDNKQFLELFDFKQQRNLQDIQLLLHDLSDDFFSRIDYVIKMNKVMYCAMLLYYMDKWIHDCYIIFDNFEDDREIYESLNDNMEQTKIAILPRVKCNWEVRKVGNNWEQALINFYYLNYEKLNDMKVKNYKIDSNVILNMEQAYLKIAISPLTRNISVKFSKPYARRDNKSGALQKLFRVEGVEREHDIEEMVISNIIEAGKNGANILVFPEMLGTENMLKNVLDKLSDFIDDNIPPLIVFPSIWKCSEADSDNTNRSCLILDGEDILFEQYKRCCFKYNNGESDVYEDLSRDSKYNEMHMLHIDNIGRICIMICYDYLDSQNRACIMENLYPTLVCNPSFSTGSFIFNILGEKYFDNGCNLIWCNTCSAMNEATRKENFNVVGVVTTLSKLCNQTAEDSFKKTFAGANMCDKQDCSNCIFYAEIPLHYIEHKEVR